MEPKIVTIGVYGSDRDSFFQALLDAHIDTFCDIRRRRGMRGPDYAFVNSQRLQQTLSKLGIRYIHVKELAPTQAIREQQKREDKELRIARRTRSELGEAFIQAYKEDCLAHFNSQKFIEQLGPEAKVIGLFCVEREPHACHRSLVAMKLAQDLGLEIEHIRVDQFLFSSIVRRTIPAR